MVLSPISLSARCLIKIYDWQYRETPRIRDGKIYIGTYCCIWRGRMLHTPQVWPMAERDPTYLRRDTYESSRFAIYAIIGPRFASRCRERARVFALMHERCHAVRFCSAFRVQSAEQFLADTDVDDPFRDVMSNWELTLFFFFLTKHRYYYWFYELILEKLKTAVVELLFD